MSVITDINHETGNLTQYTATATDGGNLSVQAGAALVGSYGMQLVINDANQLYGYKLLGATDNSTVFRGRFYVDPNGISINDGGQVSVFYLINSTTTQTFVVYKLMNIGGSFVLRGVLIDDAGTHHETVAVNITDAPHYLEFKATKATTNSSNNATLETWLDGVAQTTLTGVDCFDRFNTLIVLLGAPSQSGTVSGTFFLDDLVVNNDGSAIGPASSSIVVAPVAATVKGSRANPTVVLASLLLSPSARTVRGVTVNPTALLGSLNLSPAAGTVKGAAIAPMVQLGSVAVAPAARTVRGVAIAPTVQLGALTVSVATAVVKGTSVAPSVVLGSLSLSPAARTARAASINPSLVLGSLLITPAAGSVRSAGVDPVVQLGSIMLVPGTATFKGLTIDPTILSGGNMIVIPSAATMKGLSVSPSLVLGSIAITPAARSARAIGIDPAVQLGSITVIPGVVLVRGRAVNPTVLDTIIALGLARLRNSIVEIANLSDIRFEQAAMSDVAHEKAVTEDEPL